MKEVREDLRCVDAHAHLGNHLLYRLPADALRHYLAGVRIGELSLGPAFDGVLSWGMVDNRPFLRCLHGQGLALWALGRSAEARAVFERMLWLNPSDNQGARFLLADLDRGIAYDDQVGAEEERANPYAPRQPPPGVSRLAVDVQDLCVALEDHGDMHTWYLDRETGEVLFVPEDGGADQLPVPKEEIEDSARFLAIEPEASHVVRRDMEEFAATVASRRLRDRLVGAIAGKGAFGRFKRALAEAPAERERWAAFRAERLGRRAREWLATLGIEVVEGRKPR
jgi:tetratricopeptide (TPR) repeat protein